MTKLALSIEEAAECLGVPKGTIDLQIRRGELPFCKLGRRRVIPVEALQQFLQRATFAPDPRNQENHERQEHSPSQRRRRGDQDNGRLERLRYD